MGADFDGEVEVAGCAGESADADQHGLAQGQVDRRQGLEAAPVVTAGEAGQAAIAAPGEHLDAGVERAVRAAGVEAVRSRAARGVGEPTVAAAESAVPRRRRGGVADVGEGAVDAEVQRGGSRALVVGRTAADGGATDGEVEVALGAREAADADVVGRALHAGDRHRGPQAAEIVVAGCRGGEGPAGLAGRVEDPYRGVEVGAGRAGVGRQRAGAGRDVDEPHVVSGESTGEGRGGLGCAVVVEGATETLHDIERAAALVIGGCLRQDSGGSHEQAEGGGNEQTHVAVPSKSGEDGRVRRGLNHPDRPCRAPVCTRAS